MIAQFIFYKLYIIFSPQESIMLFIIYFILTIPPICLRKKSPDTGLPIKLDPLTILPREEEGAKPVDQEPSNDFAEVKQQLNSRPERTKK